MPTRTTVLVAAMACVAASLVVTDSASAGEPHATSVQLVSRTADGDGSAVGFSTNEHMSDDGRLVVFSSSADDLVTGDTNGHADVFLRDRDAGTTTLISRGVASAPTNGDSVNPDISGDGRFVVFLSGATNLVADHDDNSAFDDFVYDRQTEETTLVSAAHGGGFTNGSSTDPRISSNGRFIVFSSFASDLVPDDDNGQEDVFLHNRRTGETVLVSHSPDGAGADDELSTHVSVSRTGRFVAYHSFASNLVPGDANDQLDIFLYHRKTDTNSLVSHGPAGESGDGESQSPEVSDNGRFVAYHSSSTNLTPDDTENGDDVFRYDVQAGSTTLISHTPAGASANGASTEATINANGRYVAFMSSATDLMAGLPDLSPRIFGYDTSTGTVRLASRYLDGTPAKFLNLDAEISANGRVVMFSSADPLHPDDPNIGYDVYAIRLF